MSGARRCAGGAATVAKITSKYHDERPGVIPLPPGAVGDARGRPSFLETDELRDLRGARSSAGGWGSWTGGWDQVRCARCGEHGGAGRGLDSVAAPYSAVPARRLTATAGLPSGPELALQGLDGFLCRGRGVDAGREVLPAAVGDDEDDVRALARLDGLAADADRGVQCGAGGDAREDALLLEELAGAGDRVRRADGEAGGEDGGVVQLGDEALVEVAQAVDEVVVARFGGDDLDVRACARGGSGRRP